MKRLLAAVAVALLSCTLPAAAQQTFETLKKGFQPERLYHFAEPSFDSINVYNGNLIIPLSVGLTYPLNGGLTYGLSLTYNSTVWMQSEGPGGTVHAEPSLRSNAGNGWLLGMGRFVAHDDVINDTLKDIYEGPDGGDHIFDTLRETTGCGYSCPVYTSDGSNLRLRRPSATSVEIDSPDGVTRVFVHFFDEWFLSEIRSANSDDNVVITYFASVPSNVPCSAPGNSYYLIHDSENRNHYVCFRNDLPPGGFAFTNVSEIVTTPIQGQPAAHYYFSYHQSTVAKPPEIDNDSSPDWAQRHDIAVLDKLTLPDGSFYSFSNFDPVANADVAQLQKVTLPTGGTVSYQYNEIAIPSRDMCASAYGQLAIGYGFASKNTGVVSRTFTPVVPAGQTATAQTWGYASRTFLPDGGYTAIRNCNAGSTDPNAPPSDVQLYDEMVVNIVDPAGGQTKSHFSVWPGHDYGRSATNGGGSPDVSPAGFPRNNYSFPYGRYDSASNLYLSQELFDCTSGCGKKREIWVRHDIDPILVDDVPPHRLASQRTVYADDCTGDGYCPYTQSDSSDWDGYGHYRTVATSSNFGISGDLRTTTTSWNKSAGVARVIGMNSSWVLNTYEDVATTELGVTAKEQACFDLSSGFLRGKRVLAGSSPGSTDLVTVFEKEIPLTTPTGNVSAEASYGGDKTPFAHNDAQLCAALNAISGTETPAFRKTHTYQFGQLATSQADGVPFKDLDLAIDASGLISSSKDPTGRVTSYGYDTSGRLKSVAPPDVVSTQYVYDNAIVSGGYLTHAATVHATTASAQGAGTIARDYQYDSFGRLWREKRLMPDGTWSVQETLYDLKNRKKSVSALERLTIPAGGTEFGFSPALPRTLYSYDTFDRPTQIVAPDGTAVSYAYAGSRSRIRSSTIGSGASAVVAKTRELYDGQGRLVTVGEAAGTPSEQLTFYTYDIGNRLASVSMPDPTGTQLRTFTYDRRGFLTDEQHPELGVSGNGTAHYSEFDAHGHPGRKTVGTIDVRTLFDAADRPTLVTNAATNASLAQFAYDGTDPVAYPQCTSGRCLGKLVASARWNYDPDLGTVIVTQGYGYDGAGGRPSRRDVTAGTTTAFAGVSFHFGETYNDLGLPASIVYPCHPASTVCTADGVTVPFSYSNGLLSAVGSGLTAYAPAISYQPNGMLDTVTHGLGATQTLERWTSDPSGLPRPLRIRTTTPGGGELSTSGDYSYDGSGNITRIGSTAYSYDRMGRLTSWLSDSTGGGAGYVYDRFGNRTATTAGFCRTNPDGSRRCGGTTSPADPIVGTTNHRQSQTYDAAGNVTSDQGGLRVHAYDPLGMTTRAAVSGRDFRFLYTADDERVAVVERRSGANKTTWSLRNFDNQLLSIWTDDSTTGPRTVTWKEDEIWRGSSLLASTTPASTARQYTLDHLGSPRLVSDSTGSHAQDFDPFGSGGLTGSGALQFTGHERDRANVGDGTADLPDYMHARNYDPAAGRFLAVDPALDTKNASVNPQAWNRYAYVINNPLRYADPDGREHVNEPGFTKSLAEANDWDQYSAVSWAFQAQGALLSEVASEFAGAATARLLGPFLSELSLSRRIMAALRSTDPAVQLEGEAAAALSKAVTSFQRRVVEGGVEIAKTDVETAKAIVEVTGGRSPRKLEQILKYVNNKVVNPEGKRVVVFAPNLGKQAAEQLVKAGATVVRTLDELKAVAQ